MHCNTLLFRVGGADDWQLISAGGSKSLIRLQEGLVHPVGSFEGSRTFSSLSSPPSLSNSLSPSLFNIFQS